MALNALLWLAHRHVDQLDGRFQVSDAAPFPVRRLTGLGVPGEIRDAIQRAFGMNKPVVIDVVSDVNVLARRVPH